MNLTPVRLGDTAVVVGTGMIGVLTIQALRAPGCARVIAVDPSEERLALARPLGATEKFTAPAQRNADLAIECVGNKDSVRAAISAVRKGGAVTLAGNVAPIRSGRLDYL